MGCDEAASMRSNPDRVFDTSSVLVVRPGSRMTSR